MKQDIITLNENDLTNIVGGSLGAATITALLGSGIAGDLVELSGNPGGFAAACAFIVIYEAITNPPPEYSGVATALANAVY